MLLRGGKKLFRKSWLYPKSKRLPWCWWHSWRNVDQIVMCLTHVFIIQIHIIFCIKFGMDSKAAIKNVKMHELTMCIKEWEAKQWRSASRSCRWCRGRIKHWHGLGHREMCGRHAENYSNLQLTLRALYGENEDSLRTVVERMLKTGSVCTYRKLTTWNPQHRSLRYEHL